jgi:opacity protein-like surface antigen
MKYKLLVVAVTTLVASSAMAQSAFEGAYGQIGIGYESASPSFSGGTITSGKNSYAYTVNSSNNNSFTGNVALGYTFSLTPSFTLALGGEYSPIQSSSSNFTISIPSVKYSETNSYQKQNSYNIFLAPGYVIDKDKLAYVKVGYTGASVKAAGDTTNYTGYSLGLGYKQIISASWYGFAELNYSSYGNQNIGGTGTTGTSNFNSTNALVGVGYKF